MWPGPHWSRVDLNLESSRMVQRLQAGLHVVFFPAKKNPPTPLSSSPVIPLLPLNSGESYWSTH